MAITTRQDLKDYCLRKLGQPVINVNVADEQVEDRVDEALETYAEKHYDATESDWVVYTITQADVDNGYISIPSDILVVMQVMSFHDYASADNMFSYKYQIAVNELSPWQPFDQVDYFMKVTNYQQIHDMTSPEPSFNFVRHSNKLKLHKPLAELGAGYPLGVHVQRIIDPEANKAIYNDKWLKEYVTALIKLQWGENMKKFSGVQMLGGVELNGQQIYDEAVQDIEKLEETLQETYMMPIDFITG